MRKMNDVEVELPRLVVSSDGKIWYVQFKCFHAKTEKLERFRHYKGFNRRKTENDKQKYADKLIEDYTNKLVGGWRPWDQKKFIYKDEVEYRNVTAGFGNDRKDESHLRKYLSDFLIDTKKRVSGKSYESYQSKTRLFCQYLEKNNHGSLKIYEISNEIVKGFFTYLIDIRKLDKLTVLKYRQNLNQMFEYFKKKKLLEVIPTEEMPIPPKRKDNAARPLMECDMRELLIYTADRDPQFFLACMFQFFLCCRPGTELRLLKIQDIDFYNKIVYIKEAEGKTGSRIINMPTALAEICEKYKLNKFERTYYVFGRNNEPGPEPHGKNYMTRYFVKYRDLLGFPKTYKFYSFKHTGAGKILESGATLAELMNHLGHTSFESTIAYVRRHFGEKSEKIMNLKPEFLKGII